MNKRGTLVLGLVITYTLLFSSCNLIVKTPEAISNQTVATVGSKKITRGQLDNSYEFAQTKMYLAQYMGVTLDPETDLNSYYQYKNMSLGEIVDTETVLAQAEKENIVVDEDKVKEAVDAELEEFKGYFITDGVLDEEGYNEYFESLGITEETFIEYNEKLRRVEAIWEEILKDVEQPTDEEIKEEYEANKETYQGDNNKLDTDHILISTQDDKRSDEEALAIAQEVKAKLDEGADFAELAAEYSEDDSNKDDGGKLGEMTFGSLDEGYVDGAKVLKPGEISEPVKSSFGYHIIKLNSISFDGDSYEELKSVISEKLYDGKKSEEKNTLLEKYKEELPVVTTKYQNNMLNFK